MTVVSTETRMQRNDGVLDELEEMIDRSDEDGDRRIGFDEFKGLMLEIDVNHDRHVSIQELRTWWRNRHT